MHRNTPNADEVRMACKVLWVGALRQCFSLTGKVAESRGAESNSVSFVRQDGLNIQLYPYATVAIEGKRQSCN